MICPSCKRNITCPAHGDKRVEMLEDKDYGNRFVCWACVDEDAKNDCVSGFSGHLHGCDFVIGFESLAKSLGCTVEWGKHSVFTRETEQRRLADYKQV